MNQSELIFDNNHRITPSKPIICLGLTFDNEDARRIYFTELLRKKLKDPEFRKIESFPIGEDEDILHLSNPPFYTACPNPWLSDFIADWEAQKLERSKCYQYHREPFATDVSEGKNHPIYNAHSYHTKVPHRAIMRYILHYTEPGDIVFDGFCGTGMTGVAAQMCGDRNEVLALGYQVKQDGTILLEETDEDGKKVWRPFSKLGVRKAILNDLSPAATFIAHNYNTPVDVVDFEKEAKRILRELEQELGWMYETLHIDGKTKGKINYTVWSDVFVCPDCAKELIFWDVAVDRGAGEVKEKFSCPNCNAALTKKNMGRAWASSYDNIQKTIVKLTKRVPVLINYSIDGKRHQKVPDIFDLDLIDKINALDLPFWIPFNDLIDGKEIGRLESSGIKNVNQLLPIRANWILGFFLSRCATNPHLLFILSSSVINLSWMYRWRSNGKGGTTSGTYYICSTPQENNAILQLSTKLKDIKKVLSKRTNVVTTQDASRLFIAENSFDYIFLDPPFGANLMYSELSYLWESWFKIFTNNESEAIENTYQNKGVAEYRQLMSRCLKEAYRFLKPGRWLTLEFSNTKASIWNCILAALEESGFIIANVSALDKKQGSFKAVTTPTAVKQDLVISAYKPNGGFEQRFRTESRTEVGVWDFIRTHLGYLPIVKKQGALLHFVQERDPRYLWDAVATYYVRRTTELPPIDSREFQIGLSQRFIERDGMYFLPDQVAEYDRKKMASGEIQQVAMFVSDEASAIQWLRQLIKEKPQTFSDINPQFMQQLGGWSKNEAQMDLRELLQQNFLSYDGKGLVPEQIHAYLSTNWKELRNLPKDDSNLIAKAKDRWYVPDPNKAGDIEKLRERSLLKEFAEYKDSKKKLKVFRLEAVRAGFKKAWQERDYETIISVAGKIPNQVLEEDPKLLMWYDQAVTRMGVT
jgi:DNA modification methylase